MQVLQEAVGLLLRDGKILDDVWCTAHNMYNTTLKSSMPQWIQEEAGEAVPKIRCPSIGCHPEDPTFVAEEEVLYRDELN